MAQKDAVWSSWLVIIGESWRMPLAVWTKALLLSSDNYFPLERELVASFWASMQCELLTTSQRVTNWHELPIMSGALLNPPDHEVGCAQPSRNPPSNGSGIHMVMSEKILKAQLSYVKKLLKCVCVFSVVCRIWWWAELWLYYGHLLEIQHDVRRRGWVSSDKEWTCEG